MAEERKKFKDELKEQLTIDQVFDLVAELGGEPNMEADAAATGYFISRTICHNPPGQGSHKLYYYSNSHLFKCYTECDDTFDIFELIKKVNKIAGKEISLSQSIRFVANYFKVAIPSSELNENNNNEEILEDWKILRKYKEKTNIQYNKKQTDFSFFDESELLHYPRPRILPWEREGIDPIVMDNHNICYNPITQGIVIPHYDKDGNLIGVRERTLIKEQEQYGKYRPAMVNGKMYNHPLGFNLYNLNFSAAAIAESRLAIVFEGEKSCLHYASSFGEENDISVATCGSNLVTHQVDLLLEAGAREIVIAFDKQFKEVGDTEFKQWTQKLTHIHEKFSSRCTISFMFDKKGNLLNYKDSPIDADLEIFMKLFKERIRL